MREIVDLSGEFSSIHQLHKLIIVLLNRTALYIVYILVGYP